MLTDHGGPGLLQQRDGSIRPARKRWGVALFLGAAVAIAAATLAPADPRGLEDVLGCVFCGDRALADFLINVILYLPAGMGLGLLGTRLPHVLLGGALLSAVIETAQLLLPGRDASIGDVLANILGTGLGAVVVAWVAAGIGTRHGGRWALACAAMVCGVWGATGHLLTPSLPATQYYVMWTPVLGHLEWYRGRVLQSFVGGEEVRPRPVPDSPRLRRRFLEGAAIDVAFEAGPRTSRVSGLFAVYDEHQEEIVLLGPDRGDLVFRFRLRTADWRLDRPDIRLPGVLDSVAPGDTVLLRASIAGDRSCFGLGRPARCGFGFTVGVGWTMLLYPESFPPWLKWLLNGAWLAGLAAPVGFLVRRDPWSVVALTMLPLGLAAVPALTSLVASPWWEWAAAAVGLAAGAAFRRVLPTDQNSMR